MGGGVGGNRGKNLIHIPIKNPDFLIHPLYFFLPFRVKSFSYVIEVGLPTFQEVIVYTSALKTTSFIK